MRSQPVPKNNKTNITFRIDAEKRKALDRVAGELDRDRSYVLNQALVAYLETQDWHERHIKAALARADGDEATLPHHDMEAWLESWGTKSEVAPPSERRS